MKISLKMLIRSNAMKIVLIVLLYYGIVIDIDNEL